MSRAHWQYNPKGGTFKCPPGYEDLGWQLCDHPIVKSCRGMKHSRREFDNSTYLHRCTDVITICDECRYVYHTDMSD